MQFNGLGTPVGDMLDITLSDTAQTFNLQTTGILGKNFTHLLVQCQAKGVTFTDEGKVVSYTVDGTTTPTTGIGFTLGLKDYRVFTRDEISKGLKVISAEAGKAGGVYAQLYLEL